MLRSFCSASVSEIPAGSASGAACRIASGTVCEMSSSISDAPIVATISAMSAGDGPISRREKSRGSKSAVEVLADIVFTFFGRSLKLRRNVSRNHRLVGLLIEEALELGRIGNLDLKEPPLAHRIAIHQRRLIDDGLIDLGDFAAHRRINVRGGLDGFDDRRRGSLFWSRSRRRQFNEDKIAKLFLRMVCDSNGGDIAFDTKPLVVLREFQHRNRSPRFDFSRVCSDAGRKVDRRLAAQCAFRVPRRKSVYRSLPRLCRRNPWRSAPARSAQSPRT